MRLRFKSCARRDHRDRGAISSGLIAAAVCAALIAAISAEAIAGDLRGATKQMSDQAFALLNSLDARNSHGAPNPALGPTASFASDSQALSDAAAHGDMAGASNACAALQSDKAAVDAALAANPGALNRNDWNNIVKELGAISAEVAHSTGRPIAAAPNPPTTSAAAAVPPSSAAPATTASAGTSVPPPSAPATSSVASGGPQVVVESRQTSGDVVRIKGYMEGTALKSAGIYEEGQRLKSFKVSGVPGEQKVEFDIGLRNPGPDTTLRLTDGEGRSAEAHVLNVNAAAEAPSSVSIPASAGVETGPEPPPPDAGIEVDRSSRSGGVASDNTATIPSHGPLLPSPSKRHAIGGNLGNVQINVLGITQTQSMPPTYDVVGQIAGRGITRAGVYVDGRLVRRIPIMHGANNTSFDRHFVMQGGSASIRAYGVGGQFVESSLDLSSGTTAIASGVGMAPGVAIGAANPSGLIVQITTLRPIGANLYEVAGVIAGPNVASAGLYQNGMLVRNLNLGGGISRMLGALIPGVSHNASFSTEFNPYAGQASIRAFSANGAMTEQPIVIAGVNPAAPYAGGVNPYTPYSGGMSTYMGGVSPYANPYAGVSPFGIGPNPYYGAAPLNPYTTGVNPYMTGVNPYATRPAAPGRPFW